MLEVTVYRDQRGRPARLTALGHVELDAHGKDIVCAAVSGILQAARLGLDGYANALGAVEQQAGILDLEVREDRRDLESVRAIVATAEFAVEQITRQYPKQVRLKRVTVEASKRVYGPKES